MPRDPRCVYVGYSSGEVTVVMTFLQQHGIDAEIMHQASNDALWHIGSANLGGMEVWVVNPEQVREAVGLLAEMEATKLAKSDEVGEPIHVVCEDCGAELTFPASMRGTCQDCPQCRSYVDVEGDDPDSDSEVAEDEQTPSDGIQKPPGFRQPWRREKESQDE